MESQIHANLLQRLHGSLYEMGRLLLIFFFDKLIIYLGNFLDRSLMNTEKPMLALIIVLKY